MILVRLEVQRRSISPSRPGTFSSRRQRLSLKVLGVTQAPFPDQGRRRSNLASCRRWTTSPIPGNPIELWASHDEEPLRSPYREETTDRKRRAVIMNAHKMSRTMAIKINPLGPREHSSALTVFLAIGLAASTAAPGLAQTLGTWAKTGSMNSPRQYHTLALLADGQVLAAGQPEESAL